MLVTLMMFGWFAMAEAANTDTVEYVFADLTMLAVIVAVYAKLSSDESCDEDYFKTMVEEGWTRDDVNDHLNDIGMDPAAKGQARARLVKMIAGGGAESASTSKSGGAGTKIKIEPSLAGENARMKATKSGASSGEIDAAGKLAERTQELLNSDIECTSIYARALRASGGEGIRIDRALQGEDAETEMVKSSDGHVLIKTPTAVSVADKWKTWEDVSQGLSEMLQRALRDEKSHIVQRIRDIGDYCMLLSVPKRVPYVTRLFKTFYQGIPLPRNEHVLLKVTNELEAKWAGRKIDLTDDNETDDAENRKLKKEIAELKAAATAKKATGAQERKCYLCGSTEHKISDCPEACPKCSKPGANVRKGKKDCVCGEY